MLSKVRCAGLFGINGYIIDVEVDISNGLPSFDIVGLPDAAVRESKERVRAAIKNSGFDFPIKRITVNMAPADTKKEGPAYDLAIAIGILASTEQIDIGEFCNTIFIGELSLDGSIRPVQGVLPMLLSISNCIDKVILPIDNTAEASHVEGISIYPVESLKALATGLRDGVKLNPYKNGNKSYFDYKQPYTEDFIDVIGQEGTKRALEIAAAGGHNILMVGPPGSGKTMLARRIPSILPDLTYKEAIEITKLHSAAGILNYSDGLIKTRPFRSPHHTISTIALAGGGRIPKPGEISLSHNGVLYMDEMPEFRKDALEVLRQPLEDGYITVTRANGTAVFPANFMLIASMNPCPCGYYGDETKECFCTPNKVIKYMSRLSGPLLDRFDIHVEVPAMGVAKLTEGKQGEGSDSIRDRVNKAREIQVDRYKNNGFYSNSQLKSKHLNEFCSLSNAQKSMLKKAFDTLGLSARAYNRILKVSRTIADLDGSINIKDNHLSEAIQYRSLDRQYTNAYNR